MPEEFPAVQLPASNNSTGLPEPPSGLHPAVSPVAVIQMIGNKPHPEPSSEPAKNIHA
jgi:hypothetical protein